MDNMDLNKTKEKWDNTTGYEMYVGRWSNLVSIDFVDWLNSQSKLKWLEIGCGTGALTKVIAEKCLPSYLLAIDKSDNYLEKAKENVNSSNVSFLNADLSSYRLNEEFHHITSGLVLNFVPQIEELLRYVMNNLKSGGQMSSFVWDYGGHYQPMRHFWGAAKEVTSGVEKFDAGIKFKICTKEKLIQLFESLGLKDVQCTTIERIATFQDFNDYWLPIASAQGSVTEYMSTLTDTEKDKLKENIKRRLPIAFNGEIKLIISALAVKGLKK
jgi:trans-aconitate methyltransferase